MSDRMIVTSDTSRSQLPGQFGTAAQRGVPAFVLAIVSGALMTLAFPHADIGWLAFVSLVPFLSAFPFARNRTAFGYGFLFGLVYFTGLLYWIAVFAETKIGVFGVGAWLILSAREALWSGVFAAGLNLVWTRLNWVGRAIVGASIWTACEWLRQLGQLGFGWGDLAYSQWRFLPLIQIAAVTGLWGVSWLIVMLNVAIASKQPKVIAGAGAVVLIIVCLGVWHMRSLSKAAATYSASSLQANISEDVPYSGLRPASSAYFFRTLNLFDQMAAKAKAKYGATICVTAETSIPGYPNLDPLLKSMLTGIAQRNDVVLIAGSRDTDTASSEDTNSVFAFLPNGTVVGPYNKQQLVPFGEYVPYRNQLPFLNSFHVLDFEMHAGSSNQPPLDIGGGRKAGVAVCYESTYPRFLRQQVADGATFDVVVTDDTWYGRTAAAKQHMAMSVLRAVETDRYLVRCATTGISAIISPTGIVESTAGIFTRAVVGGSIQDKRDLTPFVRFGDWFPIFCLVAFAASFYSKSGGPSNID